MGDGMLGIDTRTEHGRAVLAVDGEVDVYSAHLLHEALLPLPAAGHRLVVLDLSRLTFVDSSGLGVIVGGVKRARAARGGLALVGVPDHVLKVLRVTGLDRIMPPFASLDEAFAHLDGHAAAGA
jgi:anti-sigma B factor antagonist